MQKLTVTEKLDPTKNPVDAYKKASDIPIGTWFLGRIGNYSGLFVKTYNNIVFVEQPTKTWNSNMANNDFLSIQNYQEVSSVSVQYEK